MMRRELGRGWSPRILCLLILFAIMSQGGRAEQVPVRVYTTADGLPRDAVDHIEQDSRGFLWVFTGDGLTRFDGYDFITYTTDDGLPDRRVNDLLETRGGTYWLATNGGLCRFNPRGIRLRNAYPVKPLSASPQTHTLESATHASDELMFVLYNPDGEDRKAIVFNVLWEDEAGIIWCGTNRGLYRMEERSGQVRFDFVDLGRLTASKYDGLVTAIVKDRRGALWVASDKSGLYLLLPGGRVERYTTEHGLLANGIASLLEDRAGNVWVGTNVLNEGGLCRLVPDPDPRSSIVAHAYTTQDGLPSGWIHSLQETRDGKLLVGTAAGLCSLIPWPRAGQSSFQVYSAQNGFCDKDIWGFSEDRDGNLWVASRCSLMKVARKGFTAYGATDGLDNPFVNSIFEGRKGELIVVSASVGARGRGINRFDGRGFTSVSPRLPPHVKYHGWGWGQTIIQDHTGEWWVPTGGHGLFRYPQVESFERLGSINPKAIYPTRDELRSREIFRLYEDRRGDIWIATTVVTGLVRWERSTGIFHELTEETGVPPKTDFTAFREDAQGNLWIGTAEEGGLLRYRDGRFRRFTTEDGVPPGWIISLYLDHAGRLWIASQLGGLNRVDNPSAESLRFIRYTTADGLSSNNIRSITEDTWGRIYVGTGHGVDRLDPETGRIKHYTVADGLPKNVIEHAYRDRHGALWFGSVFGVSRFVPEKEETNRPPSIYIKGLNIEGVAQPVSELGETELPSRELQPAQNHVSIDFGGLSFDLGEELQYQYKLEGADVKWSAPTATRSVNYPNLAPGAYRFVVRAVNADGQSSPTPANFSFVVLAPIWRRPWFVALLILATGLAAYTLYRYRVARLLEFANMRTRIATDLHDDIGSGLSRVAILSEVVKQQMGNTSRQSVPMLTEIAESARSLVESMREIVWAIDPRRDDLNNVIFRVRQFASDVLEPQKIKVLFQVPSELEKIKLDPEQRRHLYLIFKEAINNIARHADCSSVTLGIAVARNSLTAEICDDGCGFRDLPSQPSSAKGRANEYGNGHGLENMQSRAAQLGGHLNVDSSPGGGTRLKLTFPLKKDSIFMLS